MAEVEEEFYNYDSLLRNYQLSLIKKYSKTSSIIFLPNGSGKTEITVQLIKSYGAAITGNLVDGAKRILFMTPTKELARQRIKTLREKTPFDVCKYTGDEVVDFWPKSKWKEEFDKRQILIMTPAVMDHILTNRIATLTIFALIVVDDCQNGVEDHTIRQVMKNLKNVPDPESDQPVILCLTDTLFNRNPEKPDRECLIKELRSIETTLHAKIATCDELNEVLKHSVDPEVELILYQNKHQKPLNISNTWAYWLEKCENLDEIDKSMGKHAISYETVNQKTWNMIANCIFEDIQYALDDLGVFGASITALFHFLSILQEKCRCDDETKKSRLSFIACGINSIRSALLKLINDDDCSDNILEYSSIKVLTLLKLFKVNDDSLTIVFTQRRSTAIVLAHILRLLSAAPNSSFQHVKPTFYVEGNSNLAENVLNSKWRLKAFIDFSAQVKNTIISTSLMEDLPDCNRVIIFDDNDFNYRSFIQNKGRACLENGIFYALVDSKNALMIQKKKEQYLIIEKNLYQILMGQDDELVAPSQSKIKKYVCRETLPPFYPKGPTSPYVTGISAIACVMKYCAKLPRVPQDGVSCLAPVYFDKIEGGFQIGYVQLPMPSPLRQLIRGHPMTSKKLAKRSVFLETVKLLYQIGELTDELQPKVRKADSV